MAREKHVYSREIVAEAIYDYHNGMLAVDVAARHNIARPYYVTRWAYGERYKEIFHRYMRLVGEGKAPFLPKETPDMKNKKIDDIFKDIIGE